MRTLKTLVIAALVLSMGGVAFAELQNVEVGGKLQIRGNYWRMDNLGATSFVEQRTLLNVKADFTNDVSTFIELDSYGDWGQGFRSNYLTGIDGRGGADVNMYQAYVNVKNLWGTPLSLRVGRQELVFGSEFLLGNNDNGPLFTGLSFDAIRLSFANDMFKADAFAAKLAESFQNFGKGDVDLYGVYGSYIGIEDVTLDAYWLYVQDNTVVGRDIDIHTFGLRGAGTLSGFDFDAEVAYQMGNQDGWPSACPLGFGEADVKYDTFGANAELGYTFDMAWQPRVFGKFAYYGGGEADTCKWSNDRTLPFNRLFSDMSYSPFLDTQRNLTNIFFYSLGVQVMPTECVSLKLAGSYIDLDNSIGEQSELGWQLCASGTYHYSEDLAFTAGYSHFFGSDWDRTEDCPVHDWDGTNKPNFDYFYAQTEIAF
jgi:hypothetical protein